MGAGVTHEQPQRTERGGIPVWFSDIPGPCFASLMFRVGIADETLSTCGITHLVEHLALFTLGRRDHEYNGFVDDSRCVFYASGEEDEVLEFLRLVSSAVADLPEERLEAERRVLRAEAGHGGDVHSRLRAHRYGAGGYGLVNYHEIGLRWLGAEQVKAWARERFTAGNAVLWMTREPPEDLGLELPGGERFAAPEPQPLDVEYPAYLAEGTGGVAVTAVGKRGTALRTATSIAADRLYDQVRRERGLAYAPYGNYGPIGAGDTHLIFGSDCSDDDAPAVLDVLWSTVRGLAEDGAEEAEIERYRKLATRDLDEPDSRRGELDVLAADELTGAGPAPRSEWLPELEALTGEQVAEAFSEAMRTALLLGVNNVKAPAPGLRPFCVRQPKPVETGCHKLKGAGPANPAEIRIDDRGITHRSDTDSLVTVEWDACAAVERHPEGSLTLIGCHDCSVTVAPLAWDEGERIVEQVLAHVPPELVIPSSDAEPAAAVSQAAEAQLDAPQRVGGALTTLARALKVGEEPVELAEGMSEGVRGVFALTTKRVLWLTSEGGQQVLLEEVKDVRLPRMRFMDGPIVVAHAEYEVAVEVRPMKRAREIAAAIRERAG